VIWPEVPPEIKAEGGLAWGLFPNQNILHGETFALCYRVRPYGDDPNKCVFESYALERFPEGEEPKTEWVYAEPYRRELGLGAGAGLLQHGVRAEGHEVSGFRGTSAQSAPGAEGHQPAPQPGGIHGRARRAEAKNRAWLIVSHQPPNAPTITLPMKVDRNRTPIMVALTARGAVLEKSASSVGQ
jgi:hypothetical protein